MGNKIPKDNVLCSTRLIQLHGYFSLFFPTDSVVVVPSDDHNLTPKSVVVPAILVHLNFFCAASCSSHSTGCVSSNNSDRKTYSIGQRHQIMVDNISICCRTRFISIIVLITLYVSFDSIIYIINLDVASSPKVFNEFDYMFISNILLV